MNDDDKERIRKTFSPRVQDFLKNAEQQRKDDLLFVSQMDQEWAEIGRKLEEGLERFHKRVKAKELSPKDKKDFNVFMSKVLPELY